MDERWVGTGLLDHADGLAWPVRPERLEAGHLMMQRLGGILIHSLWVLVFVHHQHVYRVGHASFWAQNTCCSDAVMLRVLCFQFVVRKRLCLGRAWLLLRGRAWWYLQCWEACTGHASVDKAALLLLLRAL
jgi:hypothetical protein